MNGKPVTAAAIVLALLLAGCSTDDATVSETPTTKPAADETNAGKGSVTVTAADFGDEWPLTVDSGVLACVQGSSVIFTTGGSTYPVNGLAKGWAKRNGGEPDITPIWADDTESGLGLKKDIGPLIDRGHELCD